MELLGWLIGRFIGLFLPIFLISNLIYKGKTTFSFSEITLIVISIILLILRLFSFKYVYLFTFFSLTILSVIFSINIFKSKLINNFGFNLWLKPLIVTLIILSFSISNLIIGLYILPPHSLRFLIIFSVLLQAIQYFSKSKLKIPKIIIDRITISNLFMYIASLINWNN